MAGPKRLAAVKGPLARIIGGRIGESNHCRSLGLSGKTMFPIDVSGSIRLRDLGNPAPFVKPVVDRIVDMLDTAGAAEVWPEGDVVRFKTAFFAGGPGGNWNILLPFNSGTFRIEAEDTSMRVHLPGSVPCAYSLRSLQCSVLLLGIMIAGDFKHDWFSAAKILGFGWLWLFGMNLSHRHDPHTNLAEAQPEKDRAGSRALFLRSGRLITSAPALRCRECPTPWPTLPA